MTQFDPDIDYYAILQVHPTAHAEVIKRAYRTIVGLLQSHPDLGGTHEDAVRVNQAYRVLADPQLRQAYDAARRQPPGATVSPHDPRPVSSAPEPPTGEDVQRLIACPHCGVRNRLPSPSAGAHRQARCGNCHAPIGQLSSRQPEIHLPRVPRKLAPALLQQLAREGELLLRRTNLPAHRQVHCLRCGYAWTCVSVGGAMPSACPSCQSVHWSDFRLFQCRHCGHQFTTGSLHTQPYRLFPRCPACQQKLWQQNTGPHPLRWLLRKLGKAS